ncbi:ATP-binding protein [Crocosphaera sp. Alani8]|uniref:ATP-binding protein n=1 Tax=Crocosphaera sp. Alani8 TaxID=3038952 RepID=UPI00313C3B8B
MSYLPPELLEKSIVEKLAYFEGFTVAHPRLKQVYDTLMGTINEPAGASFIFVYGPSGVGKTTLKQRVEQKIIDACLPELTTDRSRIPVVGIEAVAPESRNFNWKDYYTRALIALEEPHSAPLIEHKIDPSTSLRVNAERSRSIDYGVRGVYRDIFGHVVIEPKVVAPALRRALENSLSHRKPDVFFIDEAQHMGKMSSGHK